MQAITLPEHLPRGMTLLMRPSVVIQSIDECEAILIDNGRLVHLVGSIYRRAIELLLVPVSVLDYQSAFRGVREQAMAKIALQRLMQEGLILLANEGRGHLLATQYASGLFFSPLSKLSAISINASGCAALIAAEELKSSMRDFGFEYSDDAPTEVCLVSTPCSLPIGFEPGIHSIVVFLMAEQVAILSVAPTKTSGCALLHARAQRILDNASLIPNQGTLTRLFLPAAVQWITTCLVEKVVTPLAALSKPTLSSFTYRTFSSSEHCVLGITPEFTQISEALDAAAGRGDGHSTSISQEELLRQALQIVDPLGGVTPFIRKLAESPVIVYATMHSTGDHQRSRLECSERYVAASGKGFTEERAILSCIGEAVERFCCGFTPSHTLLLSEASALGQAFLHPQAVLNFSDDQYENRSKDHDSDGGLPHVGFNWVPPRFNEELPIGWVQGREILTGEPVLFPAALTFFSYPRNSEHLYGLADSNGCAAGASLQDALLRGLLELIERDGCGIWWYNMLRTKGLDLSDCRDGDILSVIDAQKRLNRDVSLLDISTDLNIPVCAAISSRRGRNIRIGLGASLTWKAAAKRALSEMCQVSLINVDGIPKNTFDPVRADMIKWDAEADLRELAYLSPVSKRVIDWNSAEPTVERALCDVLDALKKAELPTYAINMSRADLPFKVVRAIVPGLRHFWRRLGPGRIYQIPVQLGHTVEPRQEKMMNPHSFFL